MSATSATGLSAIRLLVLTEGVHDVAAASEVLREGHRRGASIALVVRAYDHPREDRVAFARAMRRELPLTLPVIVAGSPSEAREAEADGVHLGRGVASVAEARALFGPDAWVSVPAHAPQDIVAAEREGAYAALVSPVLGVPEKGQPLGFSGLSCFLGGGRRPGVRAFALGGITAADIDPCLRAGADGIAVIRAVWRAPNPGQALAGLVEQLARRP